MRRATPIARPLANAAAVAVLHLAAAGVCRAALAPEPGVFDVSRHVVTVGGHRLHALYVKPSVPKHAEYFLVFATGDGGWHGTSEALFRHLAEQGYLMAGFSAPQALNPVRRSGKRYGIGPAATRLAELLVQTKQSLGVAPNARMIVVGFSRGASAVAFTAVTPLLRTGLAGAVAISLTRESDYLRAPDLGRRPPEIQVDKRNRILIYPALKMAGPTPFAVIESTGDHYVPAAESRTLLGPDTPTLRLYEVDAHNHSFRGGRAELLRDLDDALAWIETRH